MPIGLQEVQALKLWDNRRMKLVRLSALGSGHLYPPTPSPHTPGTNFCWRPESLCQWKNLNAPSGIEHATFRLVPSSLKLLHHRIITLYPRHRIFNDAYFLTLPTFKYYRTVPLEWGEGDTNGLERRAGRLELRYTSGSGRAGCCSYRAVHR